MYRLIDIVFILGICGAISPLPKKNIPQKIGMKLSRVEDL